MTVTLKQDPNAGEVYKANVISNVAFIANDNPPCIVQPGMQPFDLPAALVTPKGATILSSGLTPVAAVRGNQLDAPRPQPSI
jgi:hypothetical protein